MILITTMLSGLKNLGMGFPASYILIGPAISYQFTDDSEASMIPQSLQYITRPPIEVSNLPCKQSQYYLGSLAQANPPPT